MLTKEQILSCEDLKQETVKVPEWNGEVLVKGLMAEERDRFEASMIQGGQTTTSNIRAKLAALTIIDENGNHIFDDKDVVVLGKKSGAALDRVFEAASRLSGIAKGDVEELEKNS